jgi:hypothetical protein
VPPGFDALTDTDSFSVKNFIGKLTVNFRKLIKLLRPYLLTKKKLKIPKYTLSIKLGTYIKFRQFNLIRSRDFSRARIRCPTRYS